MKTLLDKPGIVIQAWYPLGQIPSSKNPIHIRDNFDILDFTFTNDEMEEIAVLNRNKRYYNSTPELLEKYVTMIPSVDEQK